uniref:ATP synthase subunit a n=1 Tax=Nemertopsis tetraclitophila TaxID=1417004 RepID=A0A075CFY7_9BILA|nr:ATP synthase F0 subunit 6 [Nemertopsis tetraclitophila]AGZ63913.1 ATP synthase F0 subunit 6 [Nemertopsis tetraclitophila]
MLSDIFSSFDEQNGNLVNFIFIWFFSLFFIFFFCFFWVKGSRLSIFVDFFFYVWSQVLQSFGFFIRGFSYFIISFFFLLVFLNFMGLVPYVFSVTSHLIFTFSLGIVLWLGLLLSSFFWSSISFFSHFLPSGAPSVLNPFLVLVETVSVGVRPITLSVRLAANMGAGHIVIGLVGTYLVGSFFSFSLTSGFFLFFVESFYFIFEFGICLIQAYIFSLLLILYSDEHSK